MVVTLYIDDLVQGIMLLIDKSLANEKNELGKSDSKSPVAPFRLINIEVLGRQIL